MAKKLTKTRERVAARSARPALSGLSDIYSFLRCNQTPMYFVSPTPYNILGIDQWVGRFQHISFFDTFAGAHPHSFVPERVGPRDFESFESVNTYLLSHKRVIEQVRLRGGGKALFVMFDDDTVEAAKDLGLEIALPPLALRNQIDSKIETTRLGDDAGVASAPNALGRAANYHELCALADGRALGRDLVVQTPFGDSGRTTFFIRDEADWAKNHRVLCDEDLKVMRRINHLPGTLEACVTRNGTLVGPVQTDLTGYSELTPYRGGWCGNDVFPDVFGGETRDRIVGMARRLGDRLGQEGYRGVFCFDFLLDTDDGEVYLGEINPRISGASPLTNLITAKYGGIPLFLFHLLEFMDVDWELDIDAVQERWRSFDGWSQLVLKQTTDEVELITKAPPSGLWRLTGDGEIRFIRPETDWHAVGGEDEAFYLQVYGAGDYCYPGADLGVIVARGRMQTDDRELHDRAKLWSSGITSQFESVPLDQAIEPPDQTYTKWF